MSFFLKKFSLFEVIYLLIRFNKTKSFLRNTKNIDTNDVNEQNTHSYTNRGITLEGIIQCQLVIPTFLEQPPYLPPPPFLWEKSTLTFFGRTLKTQPLPPPPPYYGGGGGWRSNYEDTIQVRIYFQIKHSRKTGKTTFGLDLC